MVSLIHRKEPPGQPMVARTLRAEARKSALGSAVRIIGIARAMVAISLANLAYNTKRIFWLSGGPALA